MPKREEHGLHAYRPVRHVRGGKAYRHKKVAAFGALRHDGAVVDVVRTRHAPVLDVALVLHVAPLGHVAPHMVGVHGVRALRHGTRRARKLAAVRLRHDGLADKPAPFADVYLLLPSVAPLADELVAAGAPLREKVAHALWSARMVRARPHEALLVREVARGDSVALGVRRLRPVVVLSDEVAGERESVVRVRLPVRHGASGGRLRHHVVCALQPTEEKLVQPLVVVRRLLERNPVLLDVGEAHAEAVRLHAAVAGSVGTRIVPLHAGQQAGRWIALYDVRIDSARELVGDGRPALDAAHGLAVHRVRLAPDGVGASGGREKVAFVGGVDEIPAAVDLAALASHRHDASVLLDDSAIPAVEALAAPYVESVAALPSFKDRERGRRLERPHRVLIARVDALSARTVVLAFLPFPVRRLGVVVLYRAVELPRDAAEGVLEPDVGLSQASRGETADAVRRGKHDGLQSVSLRLHRRRDSSGARPADHEIVHRLRAAELDRKQHGRQKHRLSHFVASSLALEQLHSGGMLPKSATIANAGIVRPRYQESVRNGEAGRPSLLYRLQSPIGLARCA